MKGAARLDIRSLLADKAEASKRWPSLAFMLRRREPQAPKGFVIAARGILVLAGLLFFAEGILLLTAGCMSLSFGLILLGVALALASVGLAWLGVERIRDDTCNTPVVLVAEFLSRILG